MGALAELSPIEIAHRELRARAAEERRSRLLSLEEECSGSQEVLNSFSLILSEARSLHSALAENPSYEARQILGKARAARRGIEGLIIKTRAWKSALIQEAKSIPKGRSREIAKLEQTPPWFGELDRFVFSEAADLCKARYVATGIEWHVDHCLPLQGRTVSGLHIGANIQVIPAHLNLSKGNRLKLTEPFEWVPRLDG